MRHIIMCLALVFCLFVKVVGKNKILQEEGRITKDNIDNDEAQKEDFESLEFVDDKENEIENEVGLNESDDGLSLESRLSILEDLGVSDADSGTSYRVDRQKGIVRIQKGIWQVKKINKSWVGGRIIVEEFTPKKVDKSLIRNQVSLVYGIKL